MESTGSLLIAALTLAASAAPCGAQTAQQPVQVADLPFIEIFSPTFFWNDEADTVRSGSSTCPKGRAIGGGVNILQGKAALRIVESYPDGESWVVRVVNRQKPDSVKSLQVRGYALCMLPAARKASKLIAQQARISHVSTRFSMPSGLAGTASRQACPQGSIPVAGGFGLDPDFRGPNSLRLEQSFPDANGWNVRAVNGAAAASPAADARAYAVCLGGRDGADMRGYQTVYFSEADVTVKSENGVARQSISCRDQGAYVIAGGLRSIRGQRASLEMQESFPDSPSSWTVAVTNRGDKREGDVTARLYAVCIKK
jgi:hypothetical protein